jgi:hypothetical protein
MQPMAFGCGAYRPLDRQARGQWTSPECRASAEGLESVAL